MIKIPTLLGLKLATDPRWVNLAEKELSEILIDHAYCEQKAASSCISLIVQYPEKQELVETLSPVVSEEWGHFRAVLNQMEKRGIKLGKPRKDEYVIQLSKVIRKGGSRERQLMDKLLMNAMIEARSAERFYVLSKELSDEALKKFYKDLMHSEAGHYRNFIELAELYMPAEEVKKRWTEVLEIEEEILRNLELRGDRVH